MEACSWCADTGRTDVRTDHDAALYPFRPHDALPPVPPAPDVVGGGGDRLLEALLRGKRKRYRDEEERRQAEVIIEVAVEHAVNAADKKRLGVTEGYITLTHIVTPETYSRMDLERRLALEAFVQRVQLKQKRRRDEDDEFMMF